MDEAADLNSKPLVPDEDRDMSPADVVAQLPALTEAMVMAAYSSQHEGKRAWWVISHRNGLQTKAYTLEKIGSGLGLTRERVRQIQKAATNELATAVTGDFQTRRFRLQSRVAASLAAVFAVGPSDDDPVVPEDVLLSRLGLQGRVPAVDLRRLGFLFGLRDITRTEPDSRLGAVWGLKTAESSRLRDAMFRIQEVLSKTLITGGTELEIAMAATGRKRQKAVDVRMVEAALPLLPGVERLTDGRVRARLDRIDCPWIRHSGSCLTRPAHSNSLTSCGQSMPRGPRVGGWSTSPPCQTPCPWTGASSHLPGRVAGALSVATMRKPHHHGNVSSMPSGRSAGPQPHERSPTQLDARR